MSSGQSYIPTIYAKNVIDDSVFRERLPEQVYKTFRKTIEEGAELPNDAAEAIATVMKEWAIERGATHYTHWFQPMTGATAEKHDSFLTVNGEGKAIMEFSAKQLIKGEPDASSFPSGGIRSTFEARGYTTWDCTSPAFLKEDKDGIKALCIPTAFCSYNGEALDKKTPLLKSMEAVNKSSVKVLRLLGDKETKKVTQNVGFEQEYFIIDKKYYDQRTDLKFTGRTLLGASSLKGQEFEDQYFGSIPERSSQFWKELNDELWKLGVPSITQHRETAPGQYELASIYNSANIATDHNQIVMEMLKKVGIRHDLAILLHEKPFYGINGSGKHNNWSLSTDTGKNLFKPGKNPKTNIEFLVFLVATIAATDEYATLIRSACATASNEHRLGSHEAPPAIISIFLGTDLTNVLRNLNDDKAIEKLEGPLNIGVKHLPLLHKDNTDRNRTSPFAFTGNKFEVRIVGSSMSVADVNTVLNTIVAEKLDLFAEELEKSKKRDIKVAAKELIISQLEKHGRIVFNGNNYLTEWQEEAARRGLPIVNNTVDAIKEMATEKSKALFTKYGVFTKEEIESRTEINLENYSNQLAIEAKTLQEIVTTQVIPACTEYAGNVARSLNEIKNVGIDVQYGEQYKELLEIYNNVELLKAANGTMAEHSKVLKGLKDADERARYANETIKEDLFGVRKYADVLEGMVSKDYWPLPSYSEMLFFL